MRSTTTIVLAFLIALGCGNQPGPDAPPDGDGSGNGGRSGGGRNSGGRDGSGDDGGDSSGSGSRRGSGGRGGPTGDRIPIEVGAKDCGLDNPAFCEDFESGPHPGGRSGDLDETKFAFSRWGHTLTFFDRAGAWTKRPDPVFDVQRNMPTLCGAEFSNVVIGEDARVCKGPGVGDLVSYQFQEVFDDAGDFGINSLMIRQPWDFSEGGVLVFDVDGKRNDYYEGHGWWFELWVTEDPAPVPYHTAPTVGSFPRNGLGIQFSPMGTCLQKPTEDCNEVATIFVAKNYHIIHEWPGAGNYPREGGFVARDAELNHFEVRLTKDRAEIWATDSGSTELYLVQTIEGLELNFDKGFVHLQHSHYNAFKDGRPTYQDGVWSSPAQTYRWDNIGFNGPKLPALRAYDFPLNNRRSQSEYFPETDIVKYGYDLDRKVVLTVEDVDLTGATKALLNVNMGVQTGRTLNFRINGGEEQSFTCPDYGSPGMNNYGHLRAFSIEIPLDSLVQGDNEFEFSVTKYEPWDMIGNIDLSLVVP